MKCPNCGANSKGQYCEYCGTELHQPHVINITNNYYDSHNSILQKNQQQYHQAHNISQQKQHGVLFWLGVIFFFPIALTIWFYNTNSLDIKKSTRLIIISVIWIILMIIASFTDSEAKVYYSNESDQIENNTYEIFTDLNGDLA